ncbi:MAG: nitroreductase family protein [Nitrospirota bacterium]
MDLMEAIRGRRAIRNFRPDPVSTEQIDFLLEAARLAPSGVNSQPWKFKVVTDPNLKEQVFLASKNQYHIKQAPAVIIVCGDTMSYSKTLKERFRELLDNGVVSQDDLKKMGLNLLTKDEEEELMKYKENAAFNTAIATEHIALAATSLGLGTCWVHLFDKEKISLLLGLPSWIFPVTLMPVGYPAEVPEPKPRKTIQEILL